MQEHAEPSARVAHHGNGRSLARRVTSLAATTASKCAARIEAISQPAVPPNRHRPTKIPGTGTR